MPESPFAPYRARRIAPLGLWPAGPHRLKAYAITVEGAPPPPEGVLRAAAARAAAVVPPAARAEGDAHGPGFAMVHMGTEANWLLLHWWAHGDICCQRLSRAKLGAEVFEPVDHRPLMACVWELRVVEHERAAWVGAMLTEAPDAARYLEDWLDPGLY